MRPNYIWTYNIPAELRRCYEIPNHRKDELLSGRKYRRPKRNELHQSGFARFDKRNLETYAILRERGVNIDKEALKLYEKQDDG